MTRRLHATSATLSGARAKRATVSGTAAAIAMGALCLDPAAQSTRIWHLTQTTLYYKVHRARKCSRRAYATSRVPE
jgi:hypothetical protein